MCLAKIWTYSFNIQGAWGRCLLYRIFLTSTTIEHKQLVKSRRNLLFYRNLTTSVFGISWIQNKNYLETTVVWNSKIYWKKNVIQTFKIYNFSNLCNLNVKNNIFLIFVIYSRCVPKIVRKKASSAASKITWIITLTMSSRKNYVCIHWQQPDVLVIWDSDEKCLTICCFQLLCSTSSDKHGIGLKFI